MARVLISHSARQDLHEIWDYIASDNPDAADIFIDELREKFWLLSENTKVGSDRSELLDKLKSFPHKDYLVFYAPITSGVKIVRVIHGSRDIQNIFEHPSN